MGGGAQGLAGVLGWGTAGPRWGGKGRGGVRQEGGAGTATPLPSGTQNYSGQSVFSVFPVEGVMDPGGAQDFTVTFSPDHESLYFSDRLQVVLFEKVRLRHQPRALLPPFPALPHLGGLGPILGAPHWVGSQVKRPASPVHGPHPSPAAPGAPALGTRLLCSLSQKVSQQILLKGMAREHMMFVEGGDPLDVPVESLTVIPAYDPEHRDGKASGGWAHSPPTPLARQELRSASGRLQKEQLPWGPSLPPRVPAAPSASQPPARPPLSRNRGAETHSGDTGLHSAGH